MGRIALPNRILRSTYLAHPALNHSYLKGNTMATAETHEVEIIPAREAVTEEMVTLHLSREEAETLSALLYSAVGGYPYDQDEQKSVRRILTTDIGGALRSALKTPYCLRPDGRRAEGDEKLVFHAATLPSDVIVVERDY